MGSTNQVFQSNPYADFDPSQYSNPYSQFSSGALPWPASYAGWPTDAMGNPIQPQPGMTLNSSPAQAQQAPAAAAAQPAANPIRLATTPEGMPAGQTSLGRGVVGSSWQPQQPMQQQQAAVAPPQPLQVGNPLSAQQYLALKANPGPVSNPGATVPQAVSTAGGPGVLQHFLANWNPAAGGPGAGFQQGFAKSLKGLGY
jgi:hypothetical protein